MSSAQAIAHIIDDDTWYVNQPVSKDLYIPTDVTCRTTKIIPSSEIFQMKAYEARAKGLQVDSSIDDEQDVEVELPIEVSKEVEWTETRLAFRGKRVEDDDGNVYTIPRRGSRPQKLRQEMAVAIEDPIRFVRYQHLVNVILSEIRYWKNHHMKSGYVKPVVLVLLGVKELGDEGDLEDMVYSREIYQINKYNPPNLTLTNSEGQESTVHIPFDVLKEGRIRQYVLFLPSNVHLSDSDTDEVIV